MVLLGEDTDLGARDGATRGGFDDSVGEGELDGVGLDLIMVYVDDLGTELLGGKWHAKGNSKGDQTGAEHGLEHNHLARPQLAATTGRSRLEGEWFPMVLRLLISSAGGYDFAEVCDAVPGQLLFFYSLRVGDAQNAFPN
jgi:hypothetical protein